ncbi:MAG: hypothetical protein AAF493_25020 [Pseudomonadota bacterium]
MAADNEQPVTRRNPSRAAFGAIFRYELRHRIRSLSTWVVCGMLFVFWLAASLRLGYDPNLWGTHGEVFHNAPLVLYVFLAVNGFVAFFALPVLVADSTHRDIATNTASWLFALPITAGTYFWARFFGAFVSFAGVCALASSALLVGPPLAVSLGMVEAHRVLALPIGYLADGYLKVLLPTLFVGAAVVYSAVIFAKRYSAAITATLILFLGCIIAVQLSRYERQEWIQLLNPTAFHAIHDGTLFWDVVERNTAFLSLSGSFLWNRILWIALATAILVFASRRFSFERYLAVSGRRTVKPAQLAKTLSESTELPDTQPPQRITWATAIHSLVRRTAFEVSSILKEPMFFGLFALAFLWVCINNYASVVLAIERPLPTTDRMLVSTRALWMLTFIAIPFLAATLVHRERSANFDVIVDSTPAPNWLLYGPKLCALVLLTALFPLIVLVGGVLIQSLFQYHAFEWDQYSVRLILIYFPQLLHIGIVAFGISVLTNGRIRGFCFTLLLLYASVFGYESKLVQHELLLQAYETKTNYSVFGGLGHEGWKVFWYHIYWLSIAGVFLWLGTTLWSRGYDKSLGDRFRAAFLTRSPGKWLPLVGCIGAIAAATSVIIWNQHRLNPYVSLDQRLLKAAEYERAYRPMANLPKTTPETVSIDVEFFADRRKANYSIVELGRNDTLEPISEVFISAPVFAEVGKFLYEGDVVEPTFVDPKHGVHHYKLPRSIPPGASSRIEVGGTIHRVGFSNGRAKHALEPTGLMLDQSLMPRIGYDKSRELTNDLRRRQFSLGRQPHREEGAVGITNVELDVTSEDPLRTVASGALQDVSTQAGKQTRRFRTRVAGPATYMVASGHYAVRESTLRAADGREVGLAIYHHPAHTQNVEPIAAALVRGVRFLAERLGPYPYDALQVIEIRGEYRDVKTYPGVIAIPEGKLWIADLRSPAREHTPDFHLTRALATLWWKHRLSASGASVAPALADGVPNYWALRHVMERHGPDVLQREYVRRMVESYFFKRAARSQSEKPILASVEDEGFVYKTKTALALLAMGQRFGLEFVDERLSELYRTLATASDEPDMSAHALFRAIGATMSEDDWDVLNEYFADVTYKDFRVESLRAEETEGGTYRVSFEVNAAHHQLGTTITSPAFDLEVGFRAPNEAGRSTLFDIRTFQWRPEQPLLVVELNRLPTHIELDPRRLFLDRNLPDNRARLWLSDR